MHSDTTTRARTLFAFALLLALLAPAVRARAAQPAPARPPPKFLGPPDPKPTQGAQPAQAQPEPGARPSARFLGPPDKKPSTRDAALSPPGVERITLEDAVHRAVSKNPSAQSALADIERAHGILREVRASSLPALTGNGVYTRLDADRTLPGSPATATAPAGEPRVVASKNQISGNLSLAVPLFAPQRWLQWSHAGDNVELARASAEDVRRTIAVSTARAYVAVLTQRRLAEVNLRARDDAKEHLDYAQDRLQVGTGNRLDVVRAGQEYQGDLAQVATSLAQLLRAREALSVLVGAEAPVDALDDISLPATPAPDEAVKEAEDKRSDVRAFRRRAEAAQRVLHDSWADFLPLLTGIVQPFAQHPASLTSPETGWQAQLVLSVPFYDGGARYGAREERSALAAQARLQLEGALRQARSEVRSSFEAMQRADEALAAAREAGRLAHDALDMTNLAYRAGATNDLEVVDAERRARDADTQALAAEDTARQARIDLLAASGRFP